MSTVPGCAVHHAIDELGKAYAKVSDTPHSDGVHGPRGGDTLGSLPWGRTQRWEKR